MVLVDKIFEPLDTLLMAYKSQLGEPLNIQWDNYPDLELEKRRFAIYKRLVKVTQKLVEQNQTKDKNKTQEKQEQPTPKMRKTLQSTNQEPQSPPLLRYQLENIRENLLKQVVDDLEYQNRANVPEILEEWPKKL